MGMLRKLLKKIMAPGPPSPSVTSQTDINVIAAPDKDLRFDEGAAAAALAAASEGRSQSLQHLLESSTPSTLARLLDSRDDEKRTPLIVAAGKGHVECVRLLLQHNPDVQVMARDADYATALMHAASLHPACVSLLLEHSPEVQVAATNRRQCNALMSAVRMPTSPASVALLLAHSPHMQVEAADGAGYNALMVAGLVGSASCMRLLLAYSPESQMAALAGGTSALAAAAISGHADCLQLLLAQQPSLQQLDQALLRAGQDLACSCRPMYAKFNLRVRRCMELLLAHGAMLTADGALPGAVAAVRSVSRDLAARALVPGMANEAVLGLALAKVGGRH